MGVVCQACGAENHGGVRVCRLCAAPLDVRPAPALDGEGARPGPFPSSGRWILALGLLAVLLGLWWVWNPSRGVGEASAPDGPSTTADARRPAPSGPPTEAPGETGDGLAQATAAAEARLQASLERLAREDRERSQALARERQVKERADPPAGQPRQRERPAEPERTPAVPAAVVSVAQPQAEAAASGQRSSTERAPAPAEVATPALSVEQRCADSGNFFSRTACEVRWCSDPSLARDPACVRLREIEQSRSPDPHLLN